MYWNNSTDNSTQNSTIAPVSSWPGLGPGYITFYVIIIITTIFGNVLVLVSVIQFRRLRTRTNSLILSLSVADMAVAIMVMPFALYYDMNGIWPYGWRLCSFFRSCDIMCCTASLLTICCIALDRYFAIKDPLSYHHKMTIGRIVAMISCTWIIGFMISFAPIYTGWYAIDQSGIHRDDIMTCDLIANAAFVIISSVVAFWFPCCLIMAAYLYILRIASEQAQKIKALNSQRSQATTDDKQTWKRFIKERKALKTLGLLMGVFLICWTPFFIMFPVLTFCGTCTMAFEVISFITWLGYLNSALNPILYAVFNKDFRAAFKASLVCHRMAQADIFPQTSVVQNSAWNTTQ